jgi:oxygen-independent coproporphyrinogen-3 oxidase
MLPLFPARIEGPPAVLADRAQSGPRYTSYPPATRFRADFDAAAARAELAAIPAGEAISLYCHVPFCSQLCWYCGCNVTATRDRSKSGAYVDRLSHELALLAAQVGRRPLAELALGGGSPNFLPVPELLRLVAAVYRHFVRTDDAELGVELDPRDTTAPQIAALADVGFSRLSVGVQDFDPAVQEAIHRIQSEAQTLAVIDGARRSGFRSINVDLVYGLPGQSPATLARTLDAVIRCHPDRIALFGYAHLPHLRPHQQLVERRFAVPGLPARATLLATAMDRLAAAGYQRIGLDHFARPGDPIIAAARAGTLHRNFQGYVVKRAERLLGCGPSAISDTGGAYWQNVVDLDDWGSRVDAGELPVARGVRLDADDQLRRFVIMRLMCDGRLRFDDVAAGFGVAFNESFAPELAALRAEHADLVELHDDELVTTSLGAQLIRNVCRVFDRHTPAGAAGSPTI